MPSAGDALPSLGPHTLSGFFATALLGHHPLMVEVRRKIELHAAGDLPLLIRGEPGTGKELVARSLHARSDRRERRFASLPAAPLDEARLERELQGPPGTVYFDEAGDLPDALQARLLRVMGGGEVRIVASTARDLDRLVVLGAYRREFLYRLASVAIDVPPLRRHKEDIDLYVPYFLARFAGSRNLNEIPTLEPGALDALMDYDWPGNIRELKEVLERAGEARARPASISADDLRLALAADTTPEKRRGPAPR